MDSAITQKGDLESLPLCELSCQDSNLERQNQTITPQLNPLLESGTKISKFSQNTIPEAKNAANQGA